MASFIKREKIYFKNSMQARIEMRVYLDVTSWSWSWSLWKLELMEAGAGAYCFVKQLELEAYGCKLTKKDNKVYDK